MGGMGFDGHSIEEMTELWDDIRLFQFREPIGYEWVSLAKLFYKEASLEELADLLTSYFGSRAKRTKNSFDFTIDGLLEIQLDSVALTARPTTVKDWAERECALVREIDRLLRINGVRIAKLERGRVFFQGTVLESPLA